LVFMHLWHGTTPPSFQVRGVNNPAVIGPNPAVPATVLALFGLFSIFYLAWLVPALRSVRREHLLAAIVAGLLVGLVLGAIPRTSYSPGEGRWSGIWNLIKNVPTYREHSPAMIALSAWGGAMLAASLAALPRRDRWLFAVAFAGFIASQAAGALAWQRYYEPFLLIVLPVMASRLPPQEQRTISTARIGPLALAVLLAAVTVFSLTHGASGT